MNHHHHHNQPNTDKYEHTAYYQQNDACIQTLGLEEPTNSSLRQVKGRLQINKIASESDRTSEYYDNHQSNSYLSNTNKCNQIKMISANQMIWYRGYRGNLKFLKMNIFFCFFVKKKESNWNLQFKGTTKEATKLFISTQINFNIRQTNPQ